MPPLASRVALYAVPTVPLASELVVICNGLPAATMFMLIAWVAVCAGLLESVTLNVTLVVPAAVGVPEIPPADERVKPPGRVPELTLQV